jgi:hypothetical protein
MQNLEGSAISPDAPANNVISMQNRRFCYSACAKMRKNGRKKIGLW